MIDVKGFCKLFDLNVPSLKDIDYYIEQLSKTNRFKNIKQLVALYEDAEKELGDLFKFRMDTSCEIINFIQSTQAYSDFTLDNLLPECSVTKSIQYDEGVCYLSIDMNHANWVVLKRYDPDFRNELGNSYSELLSKFGMPKIFNHSKPFRQYIFGNLNPKKQGRVQRYIITNLVKDVTAVQPPDVNIFCIRNDELVLTFKDIESVKHILSSVDMSIFKYKIFTVERVEDFRIDTVYDMDYNKLYSEMVGAYGNMFYKHLKQYITNEQMDVRDLYFIENGRLAVWVEDNLSLSLSNIR